MATPITQQQILLVEDDSDIREALSLALASEGYEVASACNVAEALALIQEHTYRLIISDLFGSQPETVLDTISAVCDQAYPTPIGVVTGWPVDPMEAERRTFAFLLRMPFDLDELIACVAAAINVPLGPEEQGWAETIQHYFATLSARDWEAFVDLCSDDVIYVLPGSSRFAGVIAGRDALREYTRQTFEQFPCTRFDDIRVHSTPTGLAASYKGSWSREDGSRAEMTGAVIFQFRGRAITRIGVRLDHARLQRLIRI